MVRRGFQPAPGILQLLLKFSDSGQAINNVLHVNNNNAGRWSEGQVEAIVDYIATTWWTTYIKPLLCPSTKLESVQGTDLTAQDTVQYTHNLSAGNAGTHAGEALPNSVTNAIKLFTGVRAKGVNGRIFIPPIPEGVVTGNVLDSAFQALWIAALNALKTELPILVANAALTVLSRYLAGVWRGAGVGRNVTVIEAANDFIDVAKRRLPEHKRKKRASV